MGLVFIGGYKRCLLSYPDSPQHRLFLRFVFEGVAYQYTVLLFGLSLAPVDGHCPLPSETEESACHEVPRRLMPQWAYGALLESGLRGNDFLPGLGPVESPLETAVPQLAGLRRLTLLGFTTWTPVRQAWILSA